MPLSGHSLAHSLITMNYVPRYTGIFINSGHDSFLHSVNHEKEKSVSCD